MLRCSDTLRYSFLALVLLTVSAAAQQGQRDFPRILPPDWRLVPSDAPNQWRAVSPPLALALCDSRPKSAATHFRRWGVNTGDRVTYRQQGRDWSVVSGYTPDNRIFYRETMLACGARKWHNLEFEYPETDKGRMEEFVTRASHALGAYNSAGC